MKGSKEIEKGRGFNFIITFHVYTVLKQYAKITICPTWISRL